MPKSDNLIKADGGEEDAYNWFRCEPMTLCQLFLQSESTYSVVSLLGESGICQFRDLNPNINAFQRKFVNEHRRCIEMERKIAFFEKEIERDNIPILNCTTEPPAPSIKEITKLESQLEKLENDLIVANKNRIMLKRKLLELTELRHILKQADQFFEDAQGPETNKTNKTMRRMSVVDAQLMRRFSTQISNSDINIPLDPVVDMFTMTGTLMSSRFLSFERMIWRICRGNILLKRMDIDENLEDPETGELQNKCLFILVVQGEKLRSNCQKICDGYHTTLHNCPDKTEERKKMHAGVVQQIEEMMIVIKQGDEHRSRILVAASKNLQQWKISLAKMRSIYEIMNCLSFDITSKCLIAECWIPSRKINLARAALQEGQTLSNSTVPSVLTVMATKETPPTYNVSNKFTAGFQAIIDSYGVSQYGEVNPAPFAIISFPFIFAVMFGDTGHGVIMTLFALWMVIREKSLAKVDGEIFSMFFLGRYIILLMGLFSIYTGLIYNDIFSKSMNFFGSEYLAPNFTDNCTDDKDKDVVYSCFKNTTNTLDPQTLIVPEYTYYFGLDPIWQLSGNKVLFLNTYKMKMSVIVGVLQMFFGVMLSIFNHVHFSKWVNVFTEFIPQVIFLLSIFGYMNFMIFFKWLSYSSANSFCAPSILITFINMFMFKQAAEEDPCYLKDPMFQNQFMIQSVLIVVAVVCIPWMLIPKPFILRAQNQKKLKQQDHDLIELQNRHPPMNGSRKKSSPSTSSDSSHIDIHDDPNAPKEEIFEFGDVFITQCIHTIEYCLGSVSHTASYLRLWALSLAHAQLSEVLWNMVMANGFMEFHTGEPGVMNIPSGIVMFVVFSVWAVLTVAVLILMEGLSAFLHALRLHWVEFMSKFYSGSGYAFIPFSFRLIISEL